MWPERNLYSLYKQNFYDRIFSEKIPDVTKKRTLEVMNVAINCCDAWNSSLDIGGGTGHYTIPLLHKFKKSTVVEIQKFPEQERLKEKYPNFSYHNQYIEDIEFDGLFDFILLADIYEHIVNIDEFIRQMSLLQGSGGVVYILTPNPLFCGPAEQSGLYHTKHLDGHRKHYFLHEIERLMGENSYDLIYHSYEESPFRQKAKRIIKGFSRRDRRWSDASSVYRSIISPFVSLIARPFLAYTEYVVYRHERKNMKNQEDMMASVYIFKKR